MSDFAGIVRWGDARPLDSRDADRLAAAVVASKTARPGFVSAAPFHAAFQQTIISPEDRWERQPATFGDAISLFAGRIDDRDHAADRLGVPAKETPDGALALAAFRRWGVELAQEVVGEYAWAAWDGGQKRLVLACDLSGACALFVYRTERIVAFATNLRALFAFPDIPREIDDVGLADFVGINPASGSRTLYRDVERVMPGTTLVIERDSPTRIIAWRAKPVVVPRRPQACAEAAREVFGQAMRARMRALGPVAISLSGGLDSSIVAAEAARLRAPEPVHGFVLVPQPDVPVAVRWWEARDDRTQVEALARQHPNLQVTYVEPDTDPLDADPTALFARLGYPVILAPNLTWMLAGWRAARAAGARIILSGMDGEIGLTHDGSLRAAARQGHVWHAMRESWRCTKPGQRRFLGNLDRAFLGGAASKMRDRDGRDMPGDWARYAALNPEFAAATGVRDRLLAEGFPRGSAHTDFGQREIVARSLRWRALASENIAALRELSGLATTSPFSDRRVIEFCLSLPEAMFVRDGQQRWLARAAFRDILPTEVRERTVKAVQNGEWFHRISGHRDAYRAQLERIETSPLAARALDLPRLKALLDAWPASAEAAEAAGSAYRSTLLRGLHVGAFLRWLDPGNKA